MRYIIFGDSGAGILDLNLNNMGVAGETDFHATLHSVFNGVIDYILENFSDTVRVYVTVIKRPEGFAAGIVLLAAYFILEIEVLIFGVEPGGFGDLLQNFADFNDRRITDQPAVFGFRAGKQVAEKLPRCVVDICAFSSSLRAFSSILAVFGLRAKDK